MRTITTSVTVYRFEELSDDAKAKAITDVLTMLGRAWDSDDDEQLIDEMVYAFAQKLGTPRVDEFGEVDFPGIPDIRVVEWDLGSGQSLKLKGTLNRENAPALPWVDGIDSVSLHGRYGSPIDVDVDGDFDTDNAVDVMISAVEAAIAHAWQAGRAQLDYLESEENAKDWIEANEPEFTEDGVLHFDRRANTVTDVSYQREDLLYTVYKVPSADYRPGLTEQEAKTLAVGVREGQSAPGFRGVEPATDSAPE